MDSCPLIAFRFVKLMAHLKQALIRASHKDTDFFKWVNNQFFAQQTYTNGHLSNIRTRAYFKSDIPSDVANEI